MTNVDEKLKAILAKQEVQIYNPEYLARVWTIMIAFGGALMNQDINLDTYQRDRFGSYYGSCIELDVKRSIETCDDIEANGIDLFKQPDPADHYENRFNGTEAEYQLSIRFLAGQLTLASGRQIWWGCQLGEDYGESSFGDLVSVIVAFDCSLPDAIEHLRARVMRAKKNNDYFSYGSKLPWIGTSAII